MLILTRRVGESIRLGDEIEIQVKAIKGNTVTIAIHAEERMESSRRVKSQHLYVQNENGIFLAANEGWI